MNEIIFIFYQILFYVTSAFLLYHTFLFLIGFLGHKQKYKLVEDKQRFCIFVPCHNEESVIAATVENLSKFTYNKNLFDIYFIADNCKDNTALEITQIINKNQLTNFFVLERNVDDPKLKGKPHAINWGINKLQQENFFYEKYDFFMILDADNFADENILEHINSQYLSYKENKRPELIQTYLDSKNKDNIISRGYYVCYRISNGFWQLSKHRLGLNPAIGGTGFAITTKFLKEIGGYNCTSLTEDLEIQTIATCKLRRIVYNGNVRIYDEKPTGLRQSMVQKTRWAQGHWYIFFKYVFKIFISLFNPKEIKYFFRKLDNMVYLFAMLNIASAITLLLIRIYFSIVSFSVPSIPMLDILILCAAIFAYLLIPISSLYDGKKNEKKRILIDFIPNVIAVTIASLIFAYASFAGLFKCGNQKVWNKTAHKVTVMKELQPQEILSQATAEQPENLEKPIEITQNR